MEPDAIFFELALADLRRAADLFGPVHDRTGGVDGFVSLEVSPRLADDAPATRAEAVRLHGLGGRPNLFIKIPGTPAGPRARSRRRSSRACRSTSRCCSRRPSTSACMEAYTRGIERRVEAGLPAYVGSVASFFISRWDAAVAATVPPELVNRLGLAIGRQAYVEYRRFFATDRWQRLLNEGARPQRLLFASTGTKDPAASDTLYVSGLAAPNTVNTMPEDTLLALADHGRLGEVLAPDAEAAAAGLARFTQAGVDVDALGRRAPGQGRPGVRDLVGRRFWPGSRRRSARSSAAPDGLDRYTTSFDPSAVRSIRSASAWSL